MTNQSEGASDQAVQWPRISIVTPSLNQGSYLDSCLRSVLSQDYPDLDYIVIDGGSRDNSVEIIHRYQNRLSTWVSEPDEGHFPALEKGFARASGEVMGWLNSDDLYLPWTLRVVGTVFAVLPEVRWVTSQYPVLVDKEGLAVRTRRLDGFNRLAFYRGRNVPLNPSFYTGFIQQESTFWRRSLWEEAGSYLTSTLPLAGEFELWARFWEHAELYAVGVPLAGFRVQPEQKTSWGQGQYLREAAQVLDRYGHRRPGPLETTARRLLRLLPRRSWRWLPENVAYSCELIRATQVEHSSFVWHIVREKFI